MESARERHCARSESSNIRRWPNVCLMLVHCLWRWPNIKQTLVQCLVFAGKARGVRTLARVLCLFILSTTWIISANIAGTWSYLSTGSPGSADLIASPAPLYPQHGVLIHVEDSHLQDILRAFTTWLSGNVIYAPSGLCLQSVCSTLYLENDAYVLFIGELVTQSILYCIILST